MTIPEIKQSLQSIDFFADVPDDQMQWLAENMEVKIYEPGDTLFKSGEPATHMYVIHDGLFNIYIDRNGQRQAFAEVGTHEITGVLPYSRMKVAGGNGEAIKRSTVFALDRNKFTDMICNQYKLTEVLVHRMTDRIRSFTTLQQQNEKLASLGKLSAGLAHELNNPAAAVVRSSEALKKHLKSTPEKFKLIMDIKVNARQVDVVNEVLFSRLQATENTHLSLMEKTALEDELTDWMDDKDMEDSMEWAEVFAEFNFCVQDFERVNQEVPDESLSTVFGWMVGNLVTEKMVGEIADASKRISDLVGSVKNYTHMDRSQDKQATDLHLGLRSTITMLGHKLRQNKVQVDEQFGEIPHIQAFPGEVNQVFTNLIDNAIDAMEANGGTLTINTERMDDFVEVRISDTGSGIAPEVMDKMFDPFFSTKEIGKGTGMGLDLVLKIMKQRHNGDIKVKSEPGNTTFTMCFSING
jgi:signal transduction histidine kinase